MLKGRSILVAGAGIAGLATALAARQAGADVTIVEQADQIEEVGAGLQISPNGAAVVSALGLAPAVAALAVRARAVVLRDYRRAGEVLRLDLGRRQDRAHWFVHRADLIGVLESAARDAGIVLRLGARVHEVVPGRMPVLGLADGERIRADLVIGADGLQSRARAALNGADAPFFTGQVAWRALVAPAEKLPAEAQLVMAPGRHLVSYPLRDGRLVNLAGFQTRSAWTEEGWTHAGDPAAFRAAFADVEGPVRSLIEAVDKVSVWGLFRHPVAPVWQKDGVALVGDAAHPTLPYLAQGANLALEDAWTLVRILQAGGGLAEYPAARRDRAVRVIAAANRNAWKYHVRFGPARVLGHLGLRLAGALAPDRMLRQFDWIYDHDVTR
ncbi:MAG: FAD-dependent monooxygenase [Marinibacterium sp.]